MQSALSLPCPMIPFTVSSNAISLQEPGRDAEALAAYENLIRDELASKNNLEQLRADHQQLP